MVIIVMGSSGSGKSTVGSLLASKLAWPFVEGDDYHPRANVEKMRDGTPLTDEDREPWLDELAALIETWHANGDDAVLACSALKRAYRQKLGLGNGILYLYLKGTRHELAGRLRNRKGHFAGLELLDSQLATLEEPASDEPNITVSISLSPGEIVQTVLEMLHHRQSAPGSRGDYA